MSDELAADSNGVRPELLRRMAAVLGVFLTAEQAATLAPQAEQHFAQLSLLDVIANSSTEPAAELRLDRWSKAGDD